MIHIFLISQDYPNIAREEIETLLGIELKSYVQGYFLTEDNFDISLVKRLGLTKEIYELKELISNADEDFVLEKLNYSLFENSYKIDIVGLEGVSMEAKPFADRIHEKLINPVVNIKKPDHKYIFFWSLTEVRFCELVFSNDDDPHNRRSHLKKFNHPTSIHPKIAKAMINMGAKREFTDPFCGAGGIAIEGAIMGLNVTSSDIDKLMIKRAKENSKEYNVNMDFKVLDALKISHETECIVTDLPYGKNSKISADLINLYCDFFTVANSLTDKMVVGIHADTDIEAYLDETDFYLWKQFTIYVHKSMSRTINILKKEN